MTITPKSRKHQQKICGESIFTQLLQLRIPNLLAAADLLKREDLETIVTSSLSRDIDEKLKHFQKSATNMDRSEGKINATMKKYYSEKPENT